MGGCSGIRRDPGPGPANPGDWDRDLKPRDSRDRDRNQSHGQAEPGQKIAGLYRPVPCPSLHPTVLRQAAP